jgi:hypothetical protein
MLDLKARKARQDKMELPEQPALLVQVIAMAQRKAR